MTMLHELGENGLRIAYREESPEPCDRVLFYSGNRLFAEEKEAGEEGRIRVPSFGELEPFGLRAEALRYLFTVAGEKYFTGKPGESLTLPEDRYPLIPVSFMRRVEPQAEAFAGAVGYQLFGWYRDNRFCSRCGAPLVHSKKERALQCSSCGYTVFPRINPSVIIGVFRGEGEDRELLVTSYNPNHVSNPNERETRKPGNYALVAGYIETGETPEQTVAREVLEEVGLRAVNIRPYRTQPWPFSGSLLLGYLCEAEPGREITLEENELRAAGWFRREAMPDRSRERNLTSAIMEAFRTGEL